MAVAFPLTPVPAWYAHCSFPTRNGIFYAGAATQPTVFLSQAGATAYAVRDYNGTVVSSGAVVSSATTVTPTPPPGGWSCGWYRIYFTGPNTDSLFGSSYGAANFVVIPDDPHFPTNPDPSVAGAGSHGENPDYVTKGVLGIGTSRLTIINAADPAASGADSIGECQTSAGLSTTWWTAHADGVRPRDLWANFPGQTYDRLNLAGSGGTFLSVYPATGSIDGATTFIAVSPGTSSGTKVQVYSPDSVTLVETYDNLASDTAAAATINATSTRIKVFAEGKTAGTTLAATAIGGSYRAGVAQVVAALYPGVRFYEGPSNEPNLASGPEVAHQMRLFQAAVHAGNASAKATGPCPVSLSLTKWDSFLAAGGAQWCDVLSFHDYNSMTGGNIPLGRYSISQWIALLAKYGADSKPRWQTEAGMAWKSVNGVYHPRRAAWKLLHILLWEQYGVPAERNTPWYDNSHGFWSYPSWLISHDGGLNPEGPILRTLTAETWGKPYASALSFGPLGDAIMIGNVYTGADGASTVVVCASAQMPGQTVTLAVTGATGPLTVVDAWGNTSTATVVSGRVTISAGSVPTYLRLPAGATATVYTIGDWPALGVRGQGTNSAPATTGLSPLITDGQWVTVYDGNNTGLYVGPASLPDTAVLRWGNPTRFDRVLIWNAMSWQAGASLLDFDVQTSTDGTTWATRATVTRTASSFQHGTDANNVGCQYETYWDEQWIFDVKLPAPVVASYLRLNVRATSYGGEPDAQTLAAGGQGGLPRIVLQEIAVLCDDNVNPQYLRT